MYIIKITHHKTPNKKTVYRDWEKHQCWSRKQGDNSRRLKKYTHEYKPNKWLKYRQEAE